MSSLPELKTGAEESGTRPSIGAVSGLGSGLSPALAPGRVMAFVDDEAARDVLARAGEEMGWASLEILPGGLEGAIARLAGVRSPDLLLVDSGDGADPLARFNALADVCEAGTTVIAFGPLNDLKLFRALTAAGIADYLLKPLTLGDLSRSVAQAMAPGPESRSAPSGRLVTVSGARGGIGASQIAAGLAWFACERAGLKTALVDLDLAFGVAPLIFDLEPGAGLAEALAQPDRIDSLFLERAALAARPGLSIFAAEAGLDPPPILAPEGVETLLEVLVEQFDAVIVDTPRERLADQPALLARSQAVVLASDLSLGGLRDSLRIVALAEGSAPAGGVHLAISQSRPPSRCDLAIRDFEKAIGRSAAAILPHDPRAMARAVAAGHPFMAEGGRAAKGMTALARQLFPLPRKGAKGGLFGFLRGGGTR